MVAGGQLGWKGDIAMGSKDKGLVIVQGRVCDLTT